MSLEAFSLTLPRNAFSVRDAARAGDVWRAFQDAAVLGSSRRGWPPARYATEECAFVVRQMTVVHHRETRFGEAVTGRTWVERFRRGLFSTRQIRFEVDGEPLADAIQEWVHVATVGGAMKVSRASDTLLASFAEHPTDEEVELPAFEALEGQPEHTFAFTTWFTWMDPLNHANHPAYVDFADEAISRVLHRCGLDPIELVPVAEQVKFKSGVLAADEVVVKTRLIGRTAVGDAVIEARVERPGEVCAEAVLVRRMVGGADALVHAMTGRG
ncbi:MAG: acyl-CoA thioesterase [Alphaproteobacteria bacterium]|nr:acyl-CoA thioesterase [Alphaproteobacteria bacterium]